MVKILGIENIIKSGGINMDTAVMEKARKQKLNRTELDHLAYSICNNHHYLKRNSASSRLRGFDQLSFITIYFIKNEDNAYDVMGMIRSVYKFNGDIYVRYTDNESGWIVSLSSP